MKKILLVFLIIVLLNNIYANPNKTIIAHNQNSIAKIQKTIQTSPQSTIEIDLRKTKDNIYIAFHDSTLNKKPINQLTYEEIKNKDNQISKIKTILEKFKNQTFNIELKEEYYEQEVVDFILDYIPEENLIITSKYLSSLEKIRQKKPQLKLGLILTKENPLKFSITWIKSRLNPKSLIKKPLEQNFFIYPDKRFVNKKFLKTAQQYNALIIPWTINTKSQIQEFLKHPQVYGVVTDKPELVV